MAPLIPSPLGSVRIVERGGAVVGLDWRRAGENVETPLLGRVEAQLGEYFAGERWEFDLPLRVEGSDFLRAVCGAMLAIPAGETRTYGEIAADLGASARAVGRACGANPVPILIPCHRVLGAGSLGGFSGASGIEAKVWLLRHEGAAGLLL